MNNSNINIGLDGRGGRDPHDPVQVQGHGSVQNLRNDMIY